MWIISVKKNQVTPHDNMQSLFAAAADTETRGFATE